MLRKKQKNNKIWSRINLKRQCSHISEKQKTKWPKTDQEQLQAEVLWAQECRVQECKEAR